MSRLAGVCLIGLALSLAGCGSHSPPKGPPVAKAYPVSGAVTFADGTRLVGGIVVFSPVEMEARGKMRYEGAGLVDAQGHYKLGLNGDGAGVPAGEYRVLVMPRDYQELPRSNSGRIPNPYRSKGSTPLTLTVTDRDNTFDIVLK